MTIARRKYYGIRIYAYAIISLTVFNSFFILQQFVQYIAKWVSAPFKLLCSKEHVFN